MFVYPGFLGVSTAEPGLPFDGLFLTLLCTIGLLSGESLAPPRGGANVFWGARSVLQHREPRPRKSAGGSPVSARWRVPTTSAALLGASEAVRGSYVLSWPREWDSSDLRVRRYRSPMPLSA
jgi:hypothetical protein